MLCCPAKGRYVRVREQHNAGGPMEKQTYRAIIQASEDSEGTSMQNALADLKQRSVLAQCCIRVFRKNYTTWERKSYLLKLPSLSEAELRSVTDFFRRYPWWRKAPYFLKPISRRGHFRLLSQEEYDQAREMMTDLVKEEEWLVQMAVEQVAARFSVSVRTMWKIWKGQYKPGKEKNHE